MNDGQPLVEDKDASPALPFETMARKVAENIGNGFGGAFVIVPPLGGEPVDMLLIKDGSDPAVFWSLVKTHAEMAIAQVDEERQRGAGGWSGRR